MRIDEFEAYKKWVSSIESQYTCGAKSVDITYLDGTTFDEHYSEIFADKDEKNKQRNRYRTPFQLFRDRILHSPLLLRLAEKTQLFTSEKGMKENRLTHTIKVVQIARSLGRGLGLNEDLIEAIAWGHDIGHPPFGHFGEIALNEWVIKMIGKKPDEGPLFKIENAPPIIQKVKPENHDGFKQYFIFGNDPEEKIFMHGKQSFTLLVFRRKPEKRERLKFIKSAIYGMWRHSIHTFKSDSYFSFLKNIDGQQVSLSGEKDLTLEAQVVRYADDIVAIISDLNEGLHQEGLHGKKLLNPKDVTTVLYSILGASYEDLVSHLNKGELDPLYTFFVYDFIETNKPKIKEGCEHIVLNLSEEVNGVFEQLKHIIKNKVHHAHEMWRGSYMNASRIKALCDWYYEKPTSFIDDLGEMSENPGFPIQAVEREHHENDYSPYVICRKLIEDNPIYRVSVITDFVSALTDMEICRLSETTP